MFLFMTEPYVFFTLCLIYFFVSWNSGLSPGIHELCLLIDLVMMFITAEFNDACVFSSDRIAKQSAKDSLD